MEKLLLPFLFLLTTKFLLTEAEEYQYNSNEESFSDSNQLNDTIIATADSRPASKEVFRQRNIYARNDDKDNSDKTFLVRTYKEWTFDKECLDNFIHNQMLLSPFLGGYNDSKFEPVSLEHYDYKRFSQLLDIKTEHLAPEEIQLLLKQIEVLNLKLGTWSHAAIKAILSKITETYPLSFKKFKSGLMKILKRWLINPQKLEQSIKENILVFKPVCIENRQKGSKSTHRTTGAMMPVYQPEDPGKHCHNFYCEHRISDDTAKPFLNKKAQDN